MVLSPASRALAGTLPGCQAFRRRSAESELELLKEIVPKLSRAAVIGTSTSPGHAQRLKELELAATMLRVPFKFVDVLESKDIERAFREASKAHAGAAVVLGGPVLIANRPQVANLAAKNRLPAIFNVPDFVEDGGLMSYGANYPDLYRRAAVYVDKILKGAKPGKLYHRAAGEVRAHHKSQGCEADWPDDTAVDVVPSRQSHQMNFGFAFLVFG